MRYSKPGYVKNILLFLLVLPFFITCKKVPDGFLSDLVRYEEDPIIIQKGRVKVSSGLNFDGSAKPVKIIMVHIYDKATGQIVDPVFLKKHTIKAWKALYNPAVDTTAELIAAKQYD